MKKGFTLVELMIVVAIIVIVSTFASINIVDRIRKNNEIRTKVIVPTVIKNTIDKAFAEGRKYYIDIPVSNEKTIKVTKNMANTTTTAIAEEISIPKGNITYTTVPSTVTQIVIGEKGNVVNNVDIIIKSGTIPFYKIEVKNITGVDIGSVRTFKSNTNTETAIWVEESGK